MRMASIIGGLAIAFLLASVPEPAHAGWGSRYRSLKKKFKGYVSPRGKRSRTRKVKKHRSRNTRSSWSYGKRRRSTGVARVAKSVGGQVGTATVEDLRRRVRSLEKKLSTLLKYVKIKGSDVIIKGSDVKISGTNIDIEANAQVKVEGSAGVALESSATASVKGAIVRINGGGHPVARVGDQTRKGKVLTGSSTVFVD